MVKPPKIRHSRPKREPVTIELGPDAVRRETVTGQEEAEKEERVADQPLDAARDDSMANEPPRDEPDHIRQEEPPRSAAEDRQPERPFQADETPVHPAPSGGTGRMLGAGIAGGALVLLLGAGLHYAGIWPRATVAADPAIAGMQSEIAALRQRVENAGGPAAGDLEAVRGEIAAASRRVDTLEQAVAALRQSVSEGGAGEQPALEEVERRLQEIEARIASSAPADTGALDELQARLGRTEGEVASIAQSMAAAQAAGTDNTRRIGDIEQRIAALQASLENDPADTRLAHVAAATTLKSAIDRGGPFEAELSAFAAIAPDSPAIAELTPYAGKGVATRATLIATVPSAASAMVTAARPVPADAGIVDRLMASAMSLVSVRPVGVVEGDDAPARIARLEAAVNSGDYAQALAEFDALPEPARAAGQVFADDLRARLAAERVVEAALLTAIQSR